LDRASLGNFGNCEPIGEGVSEMRGDKSSQKRDIRTALAMARQLKQEQGQ
jgi:putative component of toxin-antitoxin plasmid stabilization module